jgi:hypothetical protein
MGTNIFVLFSILLDNVMRAIAISCHITSWCSTCVCTHIRGLNNLKVVQEHFERRGNEGRARILYPGIKSGGIIVQLRCRSD